MTRTPTRASAVTRAAWAPQTPKRTPRDPTATGPGATVTKAQRCTTTPVTSWTTWRKRSRGSGSVPRMSRVAGMLRQNMKDKVISKHNFILKDYCGFWNSRLKCSFGSST